MSNNGKIASGTKAITPPTYHSTPRNKKKNGRSARVLTVVDVINSRTCSSSRICEMKEPVDFDWA
ncbi:hypothetical protein D3C79_888280 [compost metagenome]